MATIPAKIDPKKLAQDKAAQAKEAAKAKADGTKAATEAGKKAAADAIAADAKAKAEAKAKEKEAKAEAKAKEKEAKAEAMAAEKEAKAEALAAEKEAKAEAKAKEKEEREANKGIAKVFRSFIARIKYMMYMDTPAAGLEGVENLTWTLSYTNSKGTLYAVTRGADINTIQYKVTDVKKKLVDSGEFEYTEEALSTLIEGWEV